MELFPNVTTNWNQIISDFEDRPTYSQLKSHLLSLYRPKSKSIFDIYNPTLLRHLFQLRLGLSQLRYHKKRHGFKDTATDKCICKEGTEDTHHYFFLCPFYDNHRLVLTSEIEKILHDNEITEFNFSVELLLYGHPSLKFSENRKVITHTLEYIKNTNRLVTWSVSAPAPAHISVFTFLVLCVSCVLVIFPFVYFYFFVFSVYVLYILDGLGCKSIYLALGPCH